MDRSEKIINWTLQIFADRLEDVLHMVRQDREQLHGWQEPAHLRAAVRRTVAEATTAEGAAPHPSVVPRTLAAA